MVKKKCDVSCSSRTDAGVHGLSTYFQMDYEHDDIPIDVHEIHCGLNDKLWSAHCPIRINGVQLVDKNLFVAHRNVFSRSYLYRFAVQNSAQAIDKDSRLSSNQVTIPIEEVDRCYFIRYEISFKNQRNEPNKLIANFFWSDGSILISIDSRKLLNC